MSPIQERKILFTNVIPAKSALAWTVKKGQFLRVTDILGKQVGDLVLFNEHNLKEKFHPQYTMQHIRGPSISPQWFGGRVSVGDVLFSTIHNPMMIIVQDTQVPGGTHSLFGRMCSSWHYKKYGIGNYEGCLELLTKALKKGGWDIPAEDVPDALNLFMNVTVDPETMRWLVLEPVTRPGDYIEFRVEMDCVAALSACPWETGVINAGSSKPLQVTIYDSADPRIVRWTPWGSDRRLPEDAMFPP